MRLLHVIPYYRPSLAFGGPVSVCAKLAESMAVRGHEVRVLTTDAASRSERFSERTAQIAGVDVERLRNLSQRAVAANLQLPLHAARRLTEHAAWADVVHVHEFFSWLSYRGATVAAQLGKPVLLSGHASLSLSSERGRIGVKRLWMAMLGRATIRASRAVQATMAYEAEQCVAAGVPAHKIRIIPQGVAPPPRTGDGAAFRARHQLPQGPLFLFAGRLRASKGVDLLLEAARRLGPSGACFVLAGAAENRPDLAPGRIADNVLLTGALPERALQDAYAAASAFVLPSFAESMPLVVLDALAFGLPVVISHACNLREVVEAGAGLEADSTADALTAALEDLLARRQTWGEMGERGRALVRARYAAEHVHDQYERVYEELIRA